MYIILLSGGSGKRLWPLSTDLRPKQCIQLLDDDTGAKEKISMIQRIWRQLEESNLSRNSIICTTNDQVEILKKQLGDVKIVIEPEGRDTFPAITLSCAYLKSKMRVSMDETVCIMPVDTFTEKSYFEVLQKLPEVLEKSNSEVALMGVKPIYPSSEFGYIVPKEIDGDNMIIDHFIEKPDENTAKDLIEKNAIWNCGVFCLKIGDVLRHCEEYKLPLDYDTIFRSYNQLPKRSFDYEVLEKSEKLSAMIFRGKWKDLGTWKSFLSEIPSNAIGNVLMSNSCHNTNVINETNIPIITVGTEDLVIVASENGILVSNKEQSKNIKNLL